MKTIKTLRAIRMAVRAAIGHSRGTVSDDELRAVINKARALIGREPLGKEKGD